MPSNLPLLHMVSRPVSYRAWGVSDVIRSGSGSGGSAVAKQKVTSSRGKERARAIYDYTCFGNLTALQHAGEPDADHPLLCPSLDCSVPNKMNWIRF